MCAILEPVSARASPGSGHSTPTFVSDSEDRTFLDPIHDVILRSHSADFQEKLALRKLPSLSSLFLLVMQPIFVNHQVDPAIQFTKYCILPVLVWKHC